jgi:hypothetical protein
MERPLNIQENSPFINESIALGVEHWEDAIQFCIDRLDGKYGELNDEERESIEDELEIAKVNLEDAKKHLN